MTNSERKETLKILQDQLEMAYAKARIRNSSSVNRVRKHLKETIYKLQIKILDN